MVDVDIVMTMDCEPTLDTSHGTATGPKDFALSERAVLGYFDIAASYGLPVTYFVHPETILEQSALFKNLAARGACIGLHLHPWKYSQWRDGGLKYKVHFGQLSFEQQVVLLSETAALWRYAMGESPLYFRPGTFSANDATFRALSEVGFLGGSISAPERSFREIYSVWAGAEPDPHRTHPEFRLARGPMNFCNVPLSVDFSQPVDIGPGRSMHADLRPDIDWPNRFGISYRSIAENLMMQLHARQPSVPVINLVSHNQFEYRDQADHTRQRLLAGVDELLAAGERRNARMKGVTIKTIVDRVLNSHPVVDEFLFM